jgi:hypothetical protein
MMGEKSGLLIIICIYSMIALLLFTSTVCTAVVDINEVRDELSEFAKPINKTLLKSNGDTLFTEIESFSQPMITFGEDIESKRVVYSVCRKVPFYQPVRFPDLQIQQLVLECQKRRK